MCRTSSALKPSAFHLRERGFVRVQLRPVQFQEEVAEPVVLVGDVARAEPGIDQDQALVGLDQQAMADDMRLRGVGGAVEQAAAMRAAGAAIEVMDLHVSLHRRRRSRVSSSVTGWFLRK
jgi:hypothetical protein